MSKYNRPYVDIMAMNDEVTGSCNLGIIKFPDGENVRFVVDCGLFHEKEYEEYNNELLFNPQNIDFVLITHVHVDHVGRLPYMVQNGYNNAIYATNDTCKLLPLALRDSQKVLRTVAKRKHTKCLYSEDDVSRTLEKMKSCMYNETIQVHENVKVTFLENGHIIGAACILVQIMYQGEEEINILFTGDYNNKNVFFDVKPIPKWLLDLPLTVVQESTYGNMNSSEMKEQFRRNVINHIKINDTVIVLVFSLGRAQEILYILKKMQDNGELKEEIPIYFDGNLAIAYTNMYLKKSLCIRSDMQDFLPENLTLVDNNTRMEIVEDNNVKIIVTTSGMGSYGPAQTYLPEYITRENALIQFTGYTAEGTLGRNLKEAINNEKVEVGGIITKKRATVEYTTEFSAHAKADEMIEFLQQFSNLKLVLVNHGEIETKNNFAERIVDEVNAKRVGILGRQYFFRINKYGLDKTLSTKFE